MLTIPGKCRRSRKRLLFICAIFFLVYVILDFAANLLAPESVASFIQLNAGEETDFVNTAKRLAPISVGPFAQLNARDETDVANETIRLEKMPASPITKAKTQRTMRTCQPTNRIVFVRVPHTGGETVASILDRYGWSHGLSFVLPRNESGFDFQQPFTKEQVYGRESFKNGFDMMTSYAGYNRPDMFAMVPNAIFITTIRDPVKQFQSAFTHFSYADQLGLTHEKDPLETFLRQTENLPYLEKLDYVDKLNYGNMMGKNGQIRSLGLKRARQDAPFFIDNKIQKLEGEFDFVLLTDYLDESLLILKRLLCWTIDDILYISKNVRSTSLRFKVTDKVADMIQRWNFADMRLYDHFNRTLWSRVESYGSNFQKELTEFCRLREYVNGVCIEEMVEDPGESKLLMENGNDDKCPNWMTLSPHEIFELKRYRMRHLVMGLKIER